MTENDFEKNIDNDIKKCSRCALCVQNCPVYDIKKDENNTARGLICKLRGYQKKELSDKQIKKDLKICLNCSKCKFNCPARVDTARVFAYKNALLYPSKISQRLLLFAKLFPIKLFYFMNLFKKNANKINPDTLYFKGCVARSQHKKTFLDALYNVPSFLCCGLPYLTSGDIKNYNKAKRKNIELIKKAQVVVFDCASCLSAVLEYDELSEDDKKKLLFFTSLDVFRSKKLKTNSKYKNKTVAFHKPCHLTQAEFEKIEEFLSSIEDINYKKLDNKDLCCGFGGSYFIFHPIIALKIAYKKILSIKKTNADLVLTACPSCTLGLRISQLVFFNFKKTLELRDFIDKEMI